jgi:hypothetical protein
MKDYRRLFHVFLFAVSFAFVESAVVVYLRAIYYPEGFSFPLHVMRTPHLLVELFRELSTIVMLVSAGLLAGSTRWQKFSYFLVAFGIWDIFYYVWLKVILNWPATLFDWDILFLIPLPWIGPVIAPILVSLVMIATGTMIIQKEAGGEEFRPSLSSWLISGTASLVILYTFVRDTGATLQSQLPQPFRYEFLVPAILLYIFAMNLAFRKNRKGKSEHSTPG